MAAGSNFEEQFLIMKLKKYIIDNKITEPGTFFIYVNTKCNKTTKDLALKQQAAFKTFITKLKKDPEKTIKAFEKEKDLFIANNSSGIERGIKLKQLEK